MGWVHSHRLTFTSTRNARCRAPLLENEYGGLVHTQWSLKLLVFGRSIGVPNDFLHLAVTSLSHIAQIF